jgi:hypothetical protein
VNFIKANLMPLAIGIAIGYFVVPIVRNKLGR